MQIILSLLHYIKMLVDPSVVTFTLSTTGWDGSTYFAGEKKFASHVTVGVACKRSIDRAQWPFVLRILLKKVGA